MRGGPAIVAVSLGMRAREREREREKEKEKERERERTKTVMLVQNFRQSNFYWSIHLEAADFQ